MSTFIVGYDLNRPRKADDYPDLIKAIKTLGAWWHQLDSTWIVVSTFTAAQIRDKLTPYLDSGDELLVVQSGGIGAWKGFNTEGSNWLKSNL